MKPLDVTLAERGQMVIPQEARDALGLKAGSKLQIRLEGNPPGGGEKGGAGLESLGWQSVGRRLEPG
jgi:AbrB family looped-hinge helix DNA binding protein